MLEGEGTELNHTYHLECVSLALCLGNDTLQHRPLVQPKTPCQITDRRPEHRIRKQVRPPRHQFPFEIPAVNSTVPTVSGARHDVVVASLLLFNHRSNKLGVM